MKENVELEVSRKNAAAVLQVLARQDEKIAAQQILIETLSAQVAALSSRVTSMEQINALNRAASIGRGATVK